jgi:hypothetical protein
MNILVIDIEQDIKNSFDSLKYIEPNWNIIVSDGTLSTYNDNIDFVVVDFSKQSNHDLLDEIIKINHDQKTITVSESLICSDINGCEHCAKSFNRRRILKPIDIKSLYKIINTFDEEKCKYSYTNSFRNIESILSTVLNKFSSYSYNQNTKMIQLTEKTSYTHSIKDMLEIIEILKTHNIDYTIINDEDIKINFI